MLKINNLQARIEEKEILKGINLDIKPGEIHAIMGPNGSGKSTLASVLAGRADYEVTGGSVEFMGKDLLELSPEDRAKEGLFLAFQYPVEIPGVSTTNFMKSAVNEKRKYLTGLYDVEILTLPRISIRATRIAQSELTTIKIPAPGIVTILNTNAVPVLGSIFKEKGQALDWVCDINGNTITETITLQPGNYRLVYKNKGSKRAMTTRDERFKISSGNSATIRF